MKLFKEGDIVGPNGCVLVEKRTGDKNNRPKHLFKCGGCGEFFTSIFAPIKNGAIMGCGCKRLKNYINGEKVGPNNHIILTETRRHNYDRFFLFKCSFCNNEFESNVRTILTGDRGSCGCLKIGTRKRTDKQIMRSIRNNMLRRCHKTNSKDYHRYGGRGITVCDEWRFKNGLNNFINDMGVRPAKHPIYGEYSIDRIDNKKGYYKENCKWSTKKEQMNNRDITSNIYKYIYYIKNRNKWSIYIKYNNKQFLIGYSLNRQYAIAKYNDYIKKNNLNIPLKEREDTNVVLIDSYEIKSIFDKFANDKYPIKKMNELILKNDNELFNILNRYNIKNVLYIENVLNDNTVHLICKNIKSA